MADVTSDGTRLEQLRNLALVIAAEIDSGGEGHSMAQLARQYRETIREIAEVEDGAEPTDEIALLISASRKPAPH